RADVVRSVRDGPAREVVPLHRPLEALALRDARDLHGLALLEDVDGHRLSDLELARLVAELDEAAHRGGVCLLQVPELGFGDPLLLDRPEAELHGLVAVALVGADAGHVTGPGLDHRYPLDASIFAEHLGHPQLPAQ